MTEVVVRKRAERTLSENLHKFLAKAYKDDRFKIQIMTDLQKALKGYELNPREKNYVKNLAWSLDYFDGIKLTKLQITKIKRRVDFVKNKGSNATNIAEATSGSDIGDLD